MCWNSVHVRRVIKIKKREIFPDFFGYPFHPSFLTFYIVNISTRPKSKVPFRYLQPRAEIYLVKRQQVIPGPLAPVKSQPKFYSERIFSFEDTPKNLDLVSYILMVASNHICRVQNLETMIRQVFHPILSKLTLSVEGWVPPWTSSLEYFVQTDNKQLTYHCKHK